MPLVLVLVIVRSDADDGEGNEEDADLASIGDRGVLEVLKSYCPLA